VSVLRARLLVATSILLPVAAPYARAGDGESALSPSVGYATYSTLDKMGQSVSPTIGGAAGATYERGVSEALSWRVSAIGGGFTGGGTTWAAWGAAGLVYRFDVLKYVPYVEVSGGAILLGGGPLPTGVHPLLELGGGVDWLRSRDRSWGIEARLGSFANDTTVFTVGIRSTWRWGYF
jgi:hypothetical protein